MKNYIIDANALLSFVTDRNEKQQLQVSEILNTAAYQQILCQQNTITEFVYVMDKIYHLPKIKINQMVKDLISMPCIKIVHKIDMDITLSFWPEIIRDFGDAIIASLCKMTENSVVITFDRKFVNALKCLELDVFIFESEWSG